MKKVIMFIVLIFVFVFAFLFDGNNQLFKQNSINDSKKLEFNELIIVDDFVEFRLISIKTVSELRSAFDSNSYFKIPEPDMIFVDAVFDVKCVNDLELPCDSVMSCSTKTDKNEYNNFICLLENDDGIFEKTGMINSDKYYRIHCAIAVDRDESELILQYTIGNSTYCYLYTLFQNSGEITPIYEGDVIIDNKYADFHLNNVFVTDCVVPENFTGKYNYYKPDNPDETYVVVKYDIKNNSDVEKSGFVGIKALSDNSEYFGFNICENDDKNGFVDETLVKPGEVLHIYNLILIPESELNNLRIEISFNKKEYCYVL